MIENVTLKFMLDGKEVELPINVSEDELRKIVKVPANKVLSGYERVNEGDKFWYINPYGEIVNSEDDYFADTDVLYNVGNYFSRAEVAHGAATRLNLWMRIYAYAARMGYLVTDKEWVELESKYVLSYDYFTDTIEAVSTDAEISHWKDFGTIYFNSREAAKEVFEEFGKELYELFSSAYYEAGNL